MRASFLIKLQAEVFFSHDRDKRFFVAHFKQLHDTGKSSATVFLKIIVETNISSSYSSGFILIDSTNGAFNQR